MKNNYKHAAIIPLIGGEAIAQTNVFGSDLDYILSYSAFAKNDGQFRNYLEQEGKDIPYHVIDAEGFEHPHQVDVVSSVCPCAGLSRLNPHASSDAAANDWMYNSTQYVLENIKPRVLWGENAPGLVEKMGKPVLAKLKAIGEQYGYTLTTYRTRTLLHGYPQVRNRSFYFFCKDDKCPMLPFFERELSITIPDLIAEVNDQEPDCASRAKKPSDEFFYNAILHMKGMTHAEYIAHINSDKKNVMSKESRTAFLKEYTYADAYAHVERNPEKYGNYTAKLDRMVAKEADGKGVMYSGVFFPIDHIGAFISRYTYGLAHPVEERFISVAESLAIMGMPENFELLGGAKNINMICQNVPVGTASDMAKAVLDYLDGKLEMHEGDYLHCHNVKKQYMFDAPVIETNDLF